MRLLIIASTNERLSSYRDFADALNSFKMEIFCVHNLEYCTLSGFYPLQKITMPNLLEIVSNKIPFPIFLNLVKKFNPDFIFMDLTDYISFFCIPFLINLSNRPLLMHLRGDLMEEYKWNRLTYPSLIKRTYTHYLYTRINSNIKRANLILPNSKWLQEKLKIYIPNHQTHVLYTGINPKKWLSINDIELLHLKHPAVIGVFPFNVYPKVLGFLKFLRVINKMHDVNFYFAGSGPFLNFFNRSRPSNMYLFGGISGLGVKKLLASGDIFVHPSGLDVLPRSVKEASLMEKPIVASNIGGIPEIVADNNTGYLLDINDVDQWIERIRFLLDNSSVAKMLGKNARKFVIEKFSWEKIAKSFNVILKNFIYK